MRPPRQIPDTAAGKAADPLGDSIECHGSVNTMVRTMAASASTRTNPTVVGTALGQV
jgi:hypothetical protein